MMQRVVYPKASVVYHSMIDSSSTAPFASGTLSLLVSAGLPFPFVSLPSSVVSLPVPSS